MKINPILAFPFLIVKQNSRPILHGTNWLELHRDMCQMFLISTSCMLWLRKKGSLQIFIHFLNTVGRRRATSFSSTVHSSLCNPNSIFPLWFKSCLQTKETWILLLDHPILSERLMDSVSLSSKWVKTTAPFFHYVAAHTCHADSIAPKRMQLKLLHESPR